jgi:hypothetical protein
MKELNTVQLEKVNGGFVGLFEGVIPDSRNNAYYENYQKDLEFFLEQLKLIK